MLLPKKNSPARLGLEILYFLGQELVLDPDSLYTLPPLWVPIAADAAGLQAANLQFSSPTSEGAMPDDDEAAIPFNLEMRVLASE